MAKRKRLTPPNPAYLGVPKPDAARGPFSGTGLRAAPIADVARDAAASAAFDEMSETLTRARKEGRMILSLPLESIQSDHLVRDRVALDEEEMQVLMNSIRARGQQTPIEVTDLGQGNYGLISGWRRCEALRRLHQESISENFGEVLALLRSPNQASEAYVAMVEENEIRVGLSFYERARIVVKALDQGVFETESAALQSLFASASRAKRSKIGSFVRIVRALDDVLRFPEALSERAGLALARSLDGSASDVAALRKALAARTPDTAAAEQAYITAALKRMARPASEETGAKPQVLDSKLSDPRSSKVARDVWMRTSESGEIILTGSGVTSEFCGALKLWLKSR